VSVIVPARLAAWVFGREPDAIDAAGGSGEREQVSEGLKFALRCGFPVAGTDESAGVMISIAGIKIVCSGGTRPVAHGNWRADASSAFRPATDVHSRHVTSQDCAARCAYLRQQIPT